MPSKYSTIPKNPAIESLIQKPVVAKRADVSLRTVDTWVKTKKIPSIKIGRTIRFRWDSVEAALLRYERKEIC